MREDYKARGGGAMIQKYALDSCDISLPSSFLNLSSFLSTFSALSPMICYSILGDHWSVD